MSKPRGLFDEQYRLEKLSKHKDPLGKLSSYIDFEYFRKPLKKFFDKASDPRKGGRPAYDYIMMFKILILQHYYNLSDDSIEYAVLDRLSFMRFLGLGINDPVPDAKTIWLFRDKLIQGAMIEKLFEDWTNSSIKMASSFMQESWLMLQSWKCLYRETAGMRTKT